jgi:hypothetical protein
MHGTCQRTNRATVPEAGCSSESLTANLRRATREVSANSPVDYSSLETRSGVDHWRADTTRASSVTVRALLSCPVHPELIPGNAASPSHALDTQHLPKLDPDCACPAGASAWPSRHRGLRKLRAPSALIGNSLIALSDISSDLRTMTNAVLSPAERARHGGDQVAFWPCSARTIGFRPLRGRNPKRGRNADVAADPAAPTGSAGQLDRPAPQTSLWGTEQDC